MASILRWSTLRWINAPETREKLQGKKVRIFCTNPDLDPEL